MGYSSNVYKAAADRLFERRLKAEKEAEKRREEVYKKLPRVKELEKEISSISIKVARAVLNGKDLTSQMSRLRDENLSMQNELSEILKSNGYPENFFEPSYFCEKCSDTGYYDENGKTVVCSCMKQALVQCACDELNKTAPLSLSTFDSFQLDYYEKSTDIKTNISPYNHMAKVLSYCKNYAENFNKNSGSLFMKGKTGLGKTHLSLAIANEVIKKGFGVIYVSAPSLAHRLEKNFFSKKDNDPINDMLLECDLLIVDDLGTEFHTQFSISEIYNILNSRILSLKPIIINTNLNLLELEKIYSERFVSRIMGNAEKLDFMGTDIRVIKK